MAPSGFVSDATDCDDASADVNPSASEICDGIDNDCDGDADSDAIEVYCDMSTDGGGWTLLIGLHPASCTDYDSGEIFETQSAVGAYGDANYLSPAFYRVAFEESYLIDDVNGVAVHTDAAYSDGPLGDVIDDMLAGDSTAADIWSQGGRSGFQLRSSATSDGLCADGDIRVHWMLDAADTIDLEFPTTIDYRTDERHLVFDSDHGYAGGRIYGDFLYDVADYGEDIDFELYVR